MVRLLLGALVLVARAAGDRCDVRTLVLHCESRCAGVNATSVSSSNPPNKFLLTPVEKPMFAQLEDGTGRRLRPAREVEAVESATAFTELPPAPTNRLSNDGSPALPSTHVASTTDFTTNSAYAPTHEAMMPDQIVSAIGPVSQCARSPRTPRRAPPRCLRGRGGVRRWWSALGPPMLSAAPPSPPPRSPHHHHHCPRGRIEWQRVKTSPLGCFDGRQPIGGLYTHGGDFGEFLLGLQAPPETKPCPLPPR